MTLTEALLLVIIIVLIMYTCRGTVAKTAQKEWNCVDKQTGDVTNVKLQYQTEASKPAVASPEAKTLAENAEHFHAAEMMYGASGPDSTCAESFTAGTYAGTDIAYKDLITMQAVDPQTIRNHDEFVKDRLGPDQSQIITGKTYSIGEVEMDSINWIGIRGRPQAIPEAHMGNPTQISDVREESYVKKPRFNWSS